MAALLERASWVEPRIFGEIQRLGSVEEAEMDRVFNRGVGMALVVQADRVAAALDVLADAGHPSTVIGHVVARPPGGAGVVIA
jgi:phosphoribosylformylglycinamidine cyclo-ligase